MAKSCGTHQHAEFASFKLSRVLYKIASKIDLSTPPPKKKGARKPYAGTNLRATDEQVANYIRRNRAGENYASIAASSQESIGSIRNWCEGVNRAHILQQVIREERTQPPKVGA